MIRSNSWQGIASRKRDVAIITRVTSTTDYLKVIGTNYQPSIQTSWYVQIVRRTKEAATQAACTGKRELIIQNMRIETMIAWAIIFDHLTISVNPPPISWQMKRTSLNSLQRPTFRKVNEECKLSLFVIVPIAHIGIGFIICSYRIRDVLKTCACGSLTSSWISSCRAMTNPPLLQSRLWCSLYLKQP